MSDLALSRRAALRLAAAAPLAAVAACRRGDATAETAAAGARGSRGEAAAPVSVPLAELPEGVRVRRLRGEEPVELLRTGDTVRARSLWCTHIGCEVRWSPTHGFYDCPCHGGRFDAEGEPIAGPPTVALREIDVVRVGDAVILPPRGPGEARPRRPRPGVSA